MTRIIALLLTATLATPAAADEITDLLDSARDAYEAGDIQFALDDLEMARLQLMELKTASLGAYLPEAPGGWTREINSELNQGLAMMGGGVGAEAVYTNDNYEEVKITLLADNPLVASMSAMIANAAMLGLKTERIKRQRFAIQEDQMMALVGNRILIQTEGDVATARALLETMDFGALAGFGS